MSNVVFLVTALASFGLARVITVMMLLYNPYLGVKSLIDLPLTAQDWEAWEAGHLWIVG